jgi:DNA-binding IclR family transcriptional regulator
VGTVDKALGLLRLFSTEEPLWTVEGAAQRLGMPTSTTYRFFRSLTEAGLIADFAAGRYVIGPAIIELDRVARRTDPLIVAARGPMDELARISPADNIVLLSRIYRRRVMCVDQRSRGDHHMALSFERGRPMPLFRSSVSKVILANLSARTLARIFESDHEAVSAAGLGSTLREFRRKLREIRRAGFFISHGEVDPGVVGISAPVQAPGGDVFASISLVILEGSADAPEPESLAELVIEAGASISAELRRVSGGRASEEAQDHRREAAGGAAVP